MIFEHIARFFDYIAEFQAEFPRIIQRIAKRHYFDNSQLCFFAAYQGIGCNHF
ncbi:hypothetical protein [Symbiopectobacterium purcellii]|uniref:hypothetical protein n=1 Tax=Symbiopectobacterium purcellii TaxID=2871826 RepID=UPI003F85FC34